jgi:hypothetical protein
MNKIKFPIGDWSDDGHGKCDYFFATTRMDIKYVREAHFAAPSVIGFDIGDICRGYREFDISKSIEEKILAIFPDWQSESVDCPESLFYLWVRLLNYIDSDLSLDPICEDAEPINFYGFDNKGRHLKTPGYGLFE